MPAWLWAALALLGANVATAALTPVGGPTYSWVRAGTLAALSVALLIAWRRQHRSPLAVRVAGRAPAGRPVLLALAAIALHYAAGAALHATGREEPRWFAMLGLALVLVVPIAGMRAIRLGLRASVPAGSARGRG